MSIETIKLDRGTLAATWIGRHFPSYRKRRVMFHVTDSVTTFGTWWDSGSKAEYWQVLGGRAQRVSIGDAGPFSKSGASGIDLDTANGPVIQGGVDCGKSATLLVSAPVGFDWS